MKDLNQRMTSQEGTVLSVRDRFDDMEGNVKEVLDKMEQAEENAGNHIPLLVFKRNRSKTYISMEINDLIKILNDKEK